MKQLTFLLLLLTTLSGFTQVQKNNKSSLTIEKIMQDPEKWIGSSPENIFWDDSGNALYFSWNPEGNRVSSLYSYSLIDKKIKKVIIEEKQKLQSRNAAYNLDKSQKVFVRNGNLFLLNTLNGNERRLSDWLETVYSPEFVFNDKQISFQKNQNLYIMNLETGVIKQITNFLQGDERQERESRGQAKWLEDQQKNLFNIIAKQDSLSNARKRQGDGDEPKTPLKIYLGRGRLGNVSLSPSGKYAVYSVYQSPQGNKSTTVTNFITKSGYVETVDGRTKVGSEQSKIETRIFDIENNKIIKIETDKIPGLKDLPNYMKDYPKKIPKDNSKITQREINLIGLVWNETRDLAVLVALSVDNKDR